MSIRQLFCTLALAIAGAAVQAHQEPMPVPVRDYDVYVDLPTGFAFIKLPDAAGGWKFIGKLDAEQMRHLPAGTLTALLTPADEPQTNMLAMASAAKAEDGAR